MDNPQNLTVPNKFRYRQMLIAVFIIFLAFGLRSVLIIERAANDPSFIPRAGTDQLTYLNNAAKVLLGTFPTAPHYYHPAPAYVFAGIFALLGSQSVLSLSFVLAVLDAVTCGLILASGWLISKKAWIAYLIGILYALYPVAMFYGTVPLTEPLAMFLLALFCFVTFWQETNSTWWRTILLGIIAGGIALTRLNLLPLVGLYIIWLILLKIGWQRVLLHSLAFLVLICVTIAPITWQNYQLSGGDFIPVATTGSLELYMANNRDSAGRQGRSPAMDALDLGYYEAIIRDIQVAPEHFFGLLAYKLALFWSNIEGGNNYNFGASRDVTPILQVIPLNFLLVAMLGLLGAVGLWRDKRKHTIFLSLMLLWICAAFVISFAFSRIRLPALIPLLLLSSGVFLTLEELFQKRNYRQILKTYLVPIFLIGALFGISYWILEPSPKLPPERHYAELPADAIRLDAQFGAVILRGWRPVSAWAAAENGYLLERQAYTVELFWQLAEPTTTEYQFYLAYVDEGRRYAGIDRPLGAVSFPEFTTERWDSSTLIGEIVGIRLDETVPEAQSGQIRVGVWYWDEEGLIVSMPSNTENDILLQTLAVYQPNHAVIPKLPEANIVFGEQIILRGYRIPQQAQVGETISLEFAWEGLQKIEGDYRLFLHVLDESGEIVTQGDNRPIPSLYTQNWLPNYPLLGELPLEMPQRAGTYQVYGGLYNEVGRLPVDAPDNRIFLGTIVVQ